MGGNFHTRHRPQTPSRETTSKNRDPSRIPERNQMRSTAPFPLHLPSMGYRDTKLGVLHHDTNKFSDSAARYQVCYHRQSTRATFAVRCSPLPSHRRPICCSTLCRRSSSLAPWSSCASARRTLSDRTQSRSARTCSQVSTSAIPRVYLTKCAKMETI
jgi:hypothetical protein